MEIIKTQATQRKEVFQQHAQAARDIAKLVLTQIDDVLNNSRTPPNLSSSNSFEATPQTYPTRFPSEFI